MNDVTNIALLSLLCNPLNDTVSSLIEDIWLLLLLKTLLIVIFFEGWLLVMSIALRP